MEPDAGIGGRDAKHMRGLDKSEAVDRDELDDCTLRRWQQAQPRQDLADSTLGIDALGYAVDRGLVEQRPAHETPRGGQLPTATPVVHGNHVASDTREPGSFGHRLGSSSSVDIDDRDKDVGREVGCGGSILHPAGDVAPYPG